MPVIKYADIHAHSTIPPFNKGKSVWYCKPPTNCQRRKGRYLWDNIARPYTQSDFVSLAKGKVKVVFVSLYPMEWGLFTITRKPILNEGFFKAIWEIICCTARWIIQILGKYTFLGRILSTYPSKRIRQILRYSREYPDDLLKEYQFLKSELNCPANVAAKYGIPSDTGIEIVGNYAQLQSVLADPGKEHTMAVLVTVEGAHCLGSGQKNTLDGLPDAELNNLSNPKTAALRDKLVQGIADLKTWEHPPFFIGLDHHFWNQLAGHAMSQADGGHVLFDQRRGMNTGMTKVGEAVVKGLLSAANGKRILLDAKHMSIDTRLWFYAKVAQHNQAKPDEQKIPVVISHTGVNGIGTMQASRNSGNHKAEDERYEESDSIFNIWDINLSNEEIVAIWNSNGIIGLILDQRILGGQMVNDFLNDLPRKVRKKHDLFRQLWVKPFLDNILHIARVIDAQGSLAAGKTIWDSIVLGSDFDGRINPIDPFCNAEDLPLLEATLAERMKQMRNKGTEPLLAGKSDADIAGIVNAIMFGNVERFLSMYFTDSYMSDPLEVDSIF